MLETIKREVEAIAEQTGLVARGVSVKSVEYLREAGQWYLRVTISKAEGVSIEECTTLHRPLSKRLDEIDPIPCSYLLEVCSSGIDPQAENTACGSNASELPSEGESK